MATEKTVHRLVSEYVERLNRRIKVRKAILTGSWANGSYLEDSDVDLVVVSDDFVDMPLPRRLVYLQKYWKGRLPLEAFGYTTAEFQDLARKSSYVKDAIRQGIILFNSTRQSAPKVPKRAVKTGASRYRRGRDESSRKAVTIRQVFGKYKFENVQRLKDELREGWD